MIGVNVTVNGKVKMEGVYTAYQTNAPQAYDGFGTLEMYEGAKGVHGKDEIVQERIVLIRHEATDWQTGRYGSGLYKYEEARNLDDWLAERLLKRLRHAGPEE